MTFVDATGFFWGEREPSLKLVVTADAKDKAAFLAALAQFADNYNQSQVHTIEMPDEGSKEGDVYSDGSFNTPHVSVTFQTPLTDAQIDSLIAQSGLPGLTVTGKHADAYYAGDPNDAVKYNEFLRSARKLIALAQGSNGSASSGIRRLSIYGNGSGATSYAAIAGEVHPSPASKHITAQFEQKN